MTARQRHAAELLGGSNVTGDQTELLAHIAGMDSDEYQHFYMRFCAHDPEITAWLARGEAWAPGGRMWLAADALRKSLDADVQRRRPRARVDQRRRDLSRLTFRLLRQNAGAHALAARLQSANAELEHPLRKPELERLAVWCARRYLDDRYAR